MKQAPLNKSTAQINLRPKLKRRDKNADSPDTQRQDHEDSKFARQIMGFREWCEKVYEPSRSASTGQETVR
jgi:hypothetical protein